MNHQSDALSLPPCYVLSIDGGGARGVVAATVLQYLQEQLGVSLPQRFDVVIGTSTGALVASALLSGFSPLEIVALYKRHCRRLFRRTPWPLSLFRAKHQISVLEEILRAELGEITLKKLAGQLPTRSGRERVLIVPTFDLAPDESAEGTVSRNYRPRLFNSYFRGDEQIPAYRACCSSAAAPTYFPVYGGRYIDGGVSLNHPAMAAVAFALNRRRSEKPTYGGPDGTYKGLGLHKDQLRVLSVGCGTFGTNRINATTVGRGNWGGIQWLRYLPDLLTETNVQTSDYYVRQLLEEGQYLRINCLLPADGTLPAVAQRFSIGDPTVLDALCQTTRRYLEHIDEHGELTRSARQLLQIPLNHSAAP